MSLDVRLVKSADGALVGNMNDEELIQKAKETPFQDWSLISDLAQQASNEETAKAILKIQLSKFRDEEYANDSL